MQRVTLAFYLAQVAVLVLAETRQAQTTCDATDSSCHAKSELEAVRGKALLQHDAQGFSSIKTLQAQEVDPVIEQTMALLKNKGGSDDCRLYVYMLEQGWCPPSTCTKMPDTKVEKEACDQAWTQNIQENEGTAIDTSQAAAAKAGLDICNKEAEEREKKCSASFVEGGDVSEEEKQLGFKCSWQSCDTEALKEKYNKFEKTQSASLAAPQLSTTTETTAPPGGATHCQDSSGLQRRVRKEIHDYSDEEFEKFKNAVNKLHDKGKRTADGRGEDVTDYPNSWQAIASIHQYGHTPFRNPAPGFAVFHRHMLFDLETELQKVSGDCSITLPMWNSHKDTDGAAKSIVWNANRYGGGEAMADSTKIPGDWACDKCTGPPSHKYFCLNDGIAGGWKIEEGDLVLGGAKTEKYKSWSKSCCQCVHRGPSSRSINHNPASWADVEEKIRAPQSFEDFVKAIDSLHVHVHTTTTHGNMAYFPASGRDPVFFAHHANVDRIFTDWQKYWTENKGSTNWANSDGEETPYGLSNPGEFINFFSRIPDPDIHWKTGAELEIPEEKKYTRSADNPEETVENWMGVWDVEMNCLKLPARNPTACISTTPCSDDPLNTVCA